MTTKELKHKAKENGYTLIQVQKWGDSTDIELSPNAEYTPRLYPERTSENNTWTIATTTYGSLTVNEVEDMINGLRLGQKMVGILETIDLSELEAYYIGHDEEEQR